MNFLQIAFWVLTHAGELVELFKEFMKLVHTLPPHEQEKARQALSMAAMAGNKDAVKAVLERTLCPKTESPSGN